MSLKRVLPSLRPSPAIQNVYGIPLPTAEPGLGGMKVPVVNVGTLGGGAVFNSIPQEAWFTVDLRSLDSATQDRLESEVVRVARAAAEKAREARLDAVSTIRTPKTRRISYARGDLPRGAQMADDGSGYWLESLVTGRMKFYPFDDFEPITVPRIDERLSLAQFRDAVLRKPSEKTASGLYDEGSEYTNAKGETFFRVRGADGHLVWKRDITKESDNED